MKFNDYITEKDKRAMQVYGVISALKKNCAPFINELQKTNAKLLWRGTHKAKTSSIIQVTPRTDRTPTDMPEGIHDEFDRRFKKKFGWNVRREGVFVVSNYIDASNYGIPYIFFPVGKYQYIYNPFIKDLFSYYDDESTSGGNEFNFLLITYDDDLAGEIIEYDLPEAWEYEYAQGEQGSWYYEGADTGENDIDSAVEAAAEAEGYDEEDINPSDLEWVPEVSYEAWKNEKLKEIEGEADTWMKHTVGGYKKSNLNIAIKNEVELMFKCKSYYLIDQKFQAYIEDHILGHVPLQKPS